MQAWSAPICVIVDLSALNQFWEMFDYCDAIPSEVQG
jgi:hypothetical protein